MASPRLETFCCPNRDAATAFVVAFQPVLFGALTLASAALSLSFTVLQLLPKRKGYRRLGPYPLPRPASSSRILFIISVCDVLGCAGKRGVNYARCHFVSCRCATKLVGSFESFSFPTLSNSRHISLKTRLCQISHPFFFANVKRCHVRAAWLLKK